MFVCGELYIICLLLLSVFAQVELMCIGDVEHIKNIEYCLGVNKIVSALGGKHFVGDQKTFIWGLEGLTNLVAEAQRPKAYLTYKVLP